MVAWAALLCALAAGGLAHPHHEHREREDVVYDQRQNGSENYRLHIDGVVVALAPAEVLFNLAGLVDGFLPSGGDGDGDEEIPEDDLLPPKPEAPESTAALPEAGSEGASEALPESAALDASSTSAPAAAAPAAIPAAEEEIPNRDTSENAEKPATSDSTSTPKPTKKLKGQIFLSRWLLPLLRRL